MNDNRKKLTGILKILFEETDADHSLDTYEIMDRLSELGYGRPDRKTIDANVKFIINDLGFGIEKEKGRPNRYKWSRRKFTPKDLQLLTDAITIAPYISVSEYNELIGKLSSLTSIYLADRITSNSISVHDFRKDASVSTKIALIDDAIRHSLSVRFMLADYGMDKNEITRDNGKQYTVSPYALIWSDYNCCMIGKDSTSGEVIAYPVARIKRISVTDEPYEPKPDDFSFDGFRERVFDLTEQNTSDVVLACRDTAMNSLIERFGMNFNTIRTSYNSFNATVRTDLSPAFYGWVFSMGRDVRIISPESVRSRYEEMLNENSAR